MQRGRLSVSINEKSLSGTNWKGIFCGGDDGSRTRVRKEVYESISGCSLSTKFPPRQADKQADALVAS